MKLNSKLTLSTIILIYSTIWMIWYSFFGYQSLFHSDSAAKVLLANEIYITGNFFPKDWNYVNGDLFILFGHVFIIPFIGVLKTSFLAHAISSIALGALIIIGVYIVCKQANLSTNRATGITAIFAAGISGFVAENLYGQGSYGAIFCISIYTIYFYIKSEKSSKINKNSIFLPFLLYYRLGRIHLEPSFHISSRLPLQLFI